MQDMSVTGIKAFSSIQVAWVNIGALYHVILYMIIYIYITLAEALVMPTESTCQCGLHVFPVWSLWPGGWGRHDSIVLGQRATPTRPCRHTFLAPSNLWECENGLDGPKKVYEEITIHPHGYRYSETASKSKDFGRTSTATSTASLRKAGWITLWCWESTCERVWRGLMSRMIQVSQMPHPCIPNRCPFQW